jgi:hypothetical protein
MGYSYANNIEKAGVYLLGLLKVEGSFRYSRFYDGEDETQEVLLREMGYGPALDGVAEDEYIPECHKNLMDLATRAVGRCPLPICGAAAPLRGRSRWGGEETRDGGQA